MPISTIINSPEALHALMTTTDLTDLAQSYTQTANINMTGYISDSIAHNVGLQPYDFTGNYDGGGYTITIAGVVTTTVYTGLFDSVSGNPSKTTGIIRNVNVIYNNPITVTVTGTTAQSWGGIVGSMTIGTITNCSVTTNAAISITSGQADASHSIFCGFMGQDSVITNSQLIINNTIIIEGIDNNSLGLFCGFVADSAITNCSITASSGSYSISLKVTDDDPTPGNYSSIGIICGLCSKVLTVLNNALIKDITVNLNNNGSIILDRTGAGRGAETDDDVCDEDDGEDVKINNNVMNNYTQDNTNVDMVFDEESMCQFLNELKVAETDMSEPEYIEECSLCGLFRYPDDPKHIVICH
jgi:hypothetical protein